MNAYDQRIATRNDFLKKVDKIKLLRKAEEVMQTFLQSDRHVALTEFIYFKFLLSPQFNSINIFGIFDDYFFGTSQSNELEQFSKLENTLNKLQENTLNKLQMDNDIELIYNKKISNFFNILRSKSKYKKYVNMIILDEYASLYELLSSLLIIFVRVNELNNFRDKYITMDAATSLTPHNRLTQLMKKDNEINWSVLFRGVDPQLRNVNQHFDIAYNFENETYIGRNQKKEPFEISKKEFQKNYLTPLREIVYSILVAIYLLNISWLDKNEASKCIKKYTDAWAELDKNKWKNYVLDLNINEVLENDRKITFNEKKKLRENDFKIIKKQIKEDNLKN